MLCYGPPATSAPPRHGQCQHSLSRWLAKGEVEEEEDFCAGPCSMDAMLVGAMLKRDLHSRAAFASHSPSIEQGPGKRFSGPPLSLSQPLGKWVLTSAVSRCCAVSDTSITNISQTCFRKEGNLPPSSTSSSIACLPVFGLRDHTEGRQPSACSAKLHLVQCQHTTGICISKSDSNTLP